MQGFIWCHQNGVRTTQRRNKHLIGADRLTTFIRNKRSLTGNKIADLIAPLFMRRNLIIRLTANRAQLNETYSAQVQCRSPGIPVKLKLFTNIRTFHQQSLPAYDKANQKQKQDTDYGSKEENISPHQFQQKK